MNYQSEKDKLIDIINKIESENLGRDEIAALSRLKNEMMNDFFTVVVLGEFKRGKSTFINALLGQELLPSNVTPTTATINALMYSDEKRAQVVFVDGRTQDGEATLEFLESFTTEGSTDTSDIQYIKVGYPAEMLRNHVILVDTPGVSDINQQRVQVTYDFIPRADVVIFLLDATSPIKRTEREFIEEHIVKNGIEKVIFIANRFDEIEEEDEEDVLDEIKKRLKSAIKLADSSELQVIPFSAYLALQGAMKEDNRLMVESNLFAVKKMIETLIYDGTSPEHKLKSFTRKLAYGLEALCRETERELEIISANADELVEIIRKMTAFNIQEESRHQKLQEYAEIQKKDMLAMIRKSLQFFQVQLKEDVLEAVDHYRGTEFKHFIEKQIVSLVQKRISHWISTNSVSMNQMLGKLNRELSGALSRYFNTTIALNQNTTAVTEFNRSPLKLSIEADDISNVTTKAGLIAGSAAGLLALVGGPMLLPFVGLAGFPYLQKTMLDQKLKQAKDKIIPELTSLINQTVNALYLQIENNIEQSANQIVEQNEQRFFEIFNTYLSKMENELADNKDNKDSLLAEQAELSSKIVGFKTLINELRQG